MREAERRHPRLRAVAETLFIVAAAFVLALIIQAFVVKSYVIPTPSMVPTLMLGDRVMVNRFIFRFTEPERGDVIVFQTDMRKEPLIKRVIGVGGDRIAVHDGRLYLNGEPQVEPQLRDKVILGEFKEITVPPGEFFMMGDNRNESADSRVFGPIQRNGDPGQGVPAFLAAEPVCTACRVCLVPGTDPIPLRRPPRARNTLRRLAASTTLGPVLLLAATLVAMVLANSPWGKASRTSGIWSWASALGLEYSTSRSSTGSMTDSWRCSSWSSGSRSSERCWWDTFPARERRLFPRWPPWVAWWCPPPCSWP